MDTRERLLTAALRVFSEVGARGATTRRVAQEAGVNEVTLFRHFGTKDVLIKEALAWAAEQVHLVQLPSEPGDPSADLTAWCRAHIQGLYQARSLLRTSMSEFESDPEMSQSGCDVAMRTALDLSGYVRRLQESGLADVDVNADAAAGLLMGAMFSDAISRDIMPSRYPLALEAAADQYVSLFLRAIGAAK